MYGWQKLNVNSFMYENKGEDADTPTIEIVGFLANFL